MFVPESGIYRVSHPSHRLTHEVTVVERTLFPKCRVCGFDVRFSLLQVAEADAGSIFRPSGILTPFDSEEDESA
jgi:hypothetical protein